MKTTFIRAYMSLSQYERCTTVNSSYHQTSECYASRSTLKPCPIKALKLPLLETPRHKRNTTALKINMNIGFVEQLFKSGTPMFTVAFLT